MSDKRIAVICPGATAKEFKGRGEFDYVIGVNRGVGVVQCDYWVFADKYTFAISVTSDSPCIGKPVIVTERSIYRQAAHERPEVKDFEHLDIQEFCKSIPNKRWGLYSSTRSLAVAYHLGASEVVAYGVDWDASKPQDWDGFSDHRQRRTKRQFYEREDSQSARWKAMTKLLAEKGCTVKRYQELPKPKKKQEARDGD